MRRRSRCFEGHTRGAGRFAWARVIDLSHMPSAAPSIRAAVAVRREDPLARARGALRRTRGAGRRVWVRVIVLAHMPSAAPSIRAAVAMAFKKAQAAAAGGGPQLWLREAMREHCNRLDVGLNVMCWVPGRTHGSENSMACTVVARACGSTHCQAHCATAWKV